MRSCSLKLDFRIYSNSCTSFTVIQNVNFDLYQISRFPTDKCTCTRFLSWQISVESLNTRVKLARKNAEMAEPALEGRHP